MRYLVVGLAALAACRTPAPNRDPLLRAMADVLSFTERQRIEHAIPAVWIGLLDVGAEGGDGHRRVSVQGVRAPGADEPARTSDLLPVASLTKVITATAALRLVQDGRLRLDAAIDTALPELRGRSPAGCDLRTLLEHRSGLPAWPPIGHRAQTGAPGLSAILGSLRWPADDPDAAAVYSNAGYAVVGAMIERATGEPFDRAASALVLAPLGLGSASFQRPEVAPVGRLQTLDGRAIAWPVDASGPLPAVGLHATLDDLLTFARSWLVAPPRRVLDPAHLAQQLRGDAAVGLGCYRSTFAGQLRVGHAGTGPGFAAEFAVLPDAGCAVVVVCSLDGANAVANAIAERALLALLSERRGVQLPPPEWPTPVGTSRARELVGRYRSGDQWFDLRERAGEVWFDPCIGVATRMRWLHDALVSDDRFDLGNRTLRLPRTGVVHDGFAEFACDPPRSPPPAPAGLLPLLGEYGPAHDTLIVYEDGGRLFCLLQWQARESLQPQGCVAHLLPRILE